MKPNMTVLVVGRSLEEMSPICEILGKKGVKVVIACDQTEALNKIGEEKFDAIVADLSLPSTSCIELSKQLISDYPVVMLSNGNGDLPSNETLDLCDAFIKRPEASESLYAATIKAIQRHTYAKVA